MQKKYIALAVTVFGVGLLFSLMQIRAVQTQKAQQKANRELGTEHVKTARKRL